MCVYIYIYIYNLVYAFNFGLHSIPCVLYLIYQLIHFYQLNNGGIRVSHIYTDELPLSLGVKDLLRLDGNPCSITKFINSNLLNCGNVKSNSLEE